MKALVTGGCGFVGRHLVLRLLKLGYEVHIVDNLWTGINPARWVPPEVFQQKQLTFFEMDVMEYFQPGPKLRFDDVFHLAAVVGGRVNIQKEPIVVARDIAIDAEFFNWALLMLLKSQTLILLGYLASRI
jgi:nucleoside-diphosphate-sugar epimerase